MKAEVYRYSFDASVPLTEIEATLTLAIIGVESLHGECTTLMDVQHLFEPTKRMVVIQADTESGRDLARLFTGYLSREFPLGKFAVVRLTHEPAFELSGVA